MIQAWVGTATSYENALCRGETWVFSNPVSTDPNTVPDLTGMPALIICSPEPSTFALIAFEAVGLCAFRFRR